MKRLKGEVGEESGRWSREREELRERAREEKRKRREAEAELGEREREREAWVEEREVMERMVVRRERERDVAMQEAAPQSAGGKAVRYEEQSARILRCCYQMSCIM